jgi:hypothetical protein
VARVSSTRRRARLGAGAGALGVAAVAAVLAGCGSSAPTSPRGTTSTASLSTTRLSAAPPFATSSPRRRRPAPQGPPVGVTQRVNAGTATLAVTVAKVLDPLGDSGAALLPGTRAVGIEVTVRDESGATYDSTASGDLSVMTSAGRAAPLFVRQGACETPLTDFESLIGVGEAHSGCVGFSVPRAARIVAVRFSPHSRAAGSVVWR